MTVLVVGAGLTGATIARVIADRTDQEILVIDRRDHIAGNTYDPVLPSGIRVHAYGPHAFHTNSQRVVDFLTRFTQWQPYEHRVAANIRGLIVPVPFNFKTLMALEPMKGEQWAQHLSTRHKRDETVPMLRLLESEDPISASVAKLAYDYLFLHYTIKQWGLLPEDLGPSVTGRVPIRMGYDDRYFSDSFQALPNPGFVEMVQQMLAHPNIEVSLKTEASPSDFPSFSHVVFTGAVDELCGYELGALPYRSLDFKTEILEMEDFQGCAQMNFTVDKEYTRVTEFKHMTNQTHQHTAVTYEFPKAHVVGSSDPYYPIPRDDERSLHKEYVSLVATRFPNVVLAGRLADYRYYNMDQAVARGLTVARELLEGKETSARFH